MSRLSGVSRPTIIAGIKELEATQEEIVKVRRRGGGRKYTEEKHPEIEEHIREIVDGKTYGDSLRVLSYTSESLRKIAKNLLEKHEINVSYVTLGDILESMGYSKQANPKMLQVGEHHPDRKSQFEQQHGVCKCRNKP